jgi:hypothetical protein
VVKGIGKVTIKSKVNIFTTSDGSKIEKTEDIWVNNCQTPASRM